MRSPVSVRNHPVVDLDVVSGIKKMSSYRHIVAKLKANAERNGEGIHGEQKNYDFAIEDSKRYFGQWDICDPVSWAILRVVQAQNDFSHAIDLTVSYGADNRVLEEAIAERIKAIVALQNAIEEEPRGFQ
jgi:hypothetical protein